VERRYNVVHPRRRLWRFVANVVESAAILARRRPWLIISTGADVAVATVVLGKVFLRATVVYIETCGAIHPTLSGRVCYRFSDMFIVQWPEQLKRYPRATLARGPLV
jgi:UDP-N-acetylglucosamine:LPS N-acetylglucosamine transferase